MLDLRIYRAAFVPVLLAVAIVAFSLTDRPRGLGTSLAPDAFEGQEAAAQLRALEDAAPDDEALAAIVARSLRSSLAPAGRTPGGVAPATVRSAQHRVRTPDGHRTVTSVIAQRPGVEEGQVVVLADRSTPRGALAPLSGTAALLELGRVFSGRATRRTLTLVSTGGGAAGVRSALATLGAAPASPGGPAAALVLGDLASDALRRDQVVAWSNDRGRAPLPLVATVRGAVRAEAGAPAEPAGPLVQWLRLAVPGTLTAQGPLLRAGIPAVALQVSGERGPPPGAEVSQRRLEDYGRAALRSIGALDEAPSLPATTTAAVEVQRKLLPEWAVRLLTGALLLPLLLATVDGLARVRRRREPVLPWLRWLFAVILPFLAVGAFVVLLALVGLLPAAPPVPITADQVPVDPTALAAAGLVLLLGWLGLRPLAQRVLGAPGPPSGPGPAAAVALVLAVLTASVWAVNPHASALLLPAGHLWLLAVGTREAPPRPLALGAWAAGLLPAVLVAAVYARAWGLDPIELAWTVLLAVAGGHVGPLGIVAWSALLGCAAATALVAARRSAPAQESPAVTVRGPVGYAGPGSLGGTESALRR